MAPQKPKLPVLFSKMAAEFIGTFTLVFAGCGSIMVAERFPSAITHGGVSVIFGLAVAVMIYAVGHISGAHFNPAVTLAFAAARHFPLTRVLNYWAAQFTGAIAAIELLKVLLPVGQAYGATKPSVNPLQALAWEGILTFFLMFVIMAVATDTKAEGTMAGAAIGGTVMLAAWMGGPVTGASMNPARSLAPALFEGPMDSMWIYIVGPCLGAVLAALLYETIRLNPSNGKTGKE